MKKIWTPQKSGETYFLTEDQFNIFHFLVKKKKTYLKPLAKFPKKKSLFIDPGYRNAETFKQILEKVIADK